MKGFLYTSKRLALSSCLVVENEPPQKSGTICGGSALEGQHMSSRFLNNIKTLRLSTYQLH